MPQATRGVIVLNKSAGLSSRQAVNQIAGLLPKVKLGHAGTLDPAATGVLPVCVGRATRLVSFLHQPPKQYRATLWLGKSSATHDIEGDVRDTNFAGTISAGQLEECLRPYRGEFFQVPPMHSAVHVSGRRAYQLARRGQSAELEPRRVTIHKLECIRLDPLEVELQITCSTGTYIRSLARDLGNDLGCGAVLARLKRTAVGPFTIAQAVELADLNRSTIARHIVSTRLMVQHLPGLRLELTQARAVLHGRKIPWLKSEPELAPGAHIVLQDAQGEVLAVAVLDSSGWLQPRIVVGAAER